MASAPQPALQPSHGPAAVGATNGEIANGDAHGKTATPAPIQLNGHDAKESMLSGPYIFPRNKLKTKQTMRGRKPLCLVMIGSFSPVTILHMQMWHHAATSLKEPLQNEESYEWVAGYFSPVGDSYKKAGLAPAYHRVRMLDLACEGEERIMVDRYEALQSEYVRTAEVLDHFEEQLNRIGGGVEDVEGNKVSIKIALLVGADLLHTMGDPKIWSKEDLDYIFDNFGVFVVERTGTDLDNALKALGKRAARIKVLEQPFPNDISSTKIRGRRKRGLSIGYLVPDRVVDYIKENDLYPEETSADQTPNGEEKDR